jgi:hypothetical protein
MLAPLAAEQRASAWASLADTFTEKGLREEARRAAAGPDYADDAAQRSDRIRAFMWISGPPNTARAPASPCGAFSSR